MAKNCVLITLIVLLFSSDLASQITPGTAFGTYKNIFGEVPAQEMLTFKAYLLNNPEIVVTESSFDCQYNAQWGGYWVVNLSLLDNWQGKILRIEFTDQSKGDPPLQTSFQSIVGGTISDFGKMDTEIQLTGAGFTNDGAHNTIYWTVAEERDILHYRLLQSTEANQFAYLDADPIPAEGKEAYNFVDQQNNTTQKFYLLEEIHADGSTYRHGPIPHQEKGGASAVAEKKHETATPGTFQLLQNFPNPFGHAEKSQTKITFWLPEKASYSLRIFNLVGAVVREFTGDTHINKLHTVIWNAKDATGTKVPAGIYCYQLTTSSNTASKKMLLLH